MQLAWSRIWTRVAVSISYDQSCLYKYQSCLYKYIIYTWSGFVGFYDISTIVGYLMPNPVYAYELDI